RSRNLGDADGAALAHLGAPDGGEEAVDGAEGMLARDIDDLGGPARLGGDRALAPQRGQSCPDRRAADTVLLRQLEFAGKASLKSPERILDSRSSRTAAHSG